MPVNVNKLTIKTNVKEHIPGAPTAGASAGLATAEEDFRELLMDMQEEDNER